MARRTFRYSSTVKMPPPSLTPERAKVAEFYSAGSGTIPPLPWHTFPPPFSGTPLPPHYRRKPVSTAGVGPGFRRDGEMFDPAKFGTRTLKFNTNAKAGPTARIFGRGASLTSLLPAQALCRIRTDARTRRLIAWQP